jgi:polysaccharide export outer membrane protein
VLLALGGCAIALTSTACAQRYQPISSAEANAHVADPRVGPGDRLRITVYDEPTLTGEYEIGASGAVTLPLIAEVGVADATPESVAATVAAKLTSGGYVLNPRVSVDVISHRPFYILGEVAKPGEYIYAGRLSLLQAIAKAGGFTARANKGSAIVQRMGWDGARKIPVSDPGVMIAPGDTITITEALL